MSNTKKMEGGPEEEDMEGGKSETKLVRDNMIELVKVTTKND
jgi:hypothetical protein